MKIDERPRQLPQGRRRRQGAVDEAAAPAGGGNLASYDELTAVGSLKDRLDRGAVFTRPDELGGGASAYQEPDGTDEDGLPGAGLAGEDVETWFELQLELVDDRQIADGEEAQHIGQVPSYQMFDSEN